MRRATWQRLAWLSRSDGGHRLPLASASCHQPTALEQQHRPPRLWYLHTTELGRHQAVCEWTYKVSAWQQVQQPCMLAMSNSKYGHL